ncbi:MAG: phenylalanine--tRNA ligase subunit beta [bacterium]|nr:phenylalanine--tRNA ligase subunit beta [bacterium]
MRFSYDLLKKLVPEAASQAELMETLTMHALPAEDPRGKTFDAELPSNRYADLASHIGLAREYAAIAGKKLKEPEAKAVFPVKGKGRVEVEIRNPGHCPRYGAALFELKSQGKTPAWMGKVLEDCGLRLINPVVDILNYVMLETGQPMHAFDADKLALPVTVRLAKAGEEVTTIDNQKFILTKNDLVIADAKEAQAIAGIKGGKASEVGKATKAILVEAANFEQTSIYETSKSLKLMTDASTRFAHGLSPHSVEIGMNRARFLLEQITRARLIDALDIYPKKQNSRLIGYSVAKGNAILGLELTEAQVLKNLRALGFKKIARKSKGKNDDFIVEVPPLRLDIEIFEDLVEEVVRLYGIDKLKPAAPSISLTPAGEGDLTIFKDRVRNTLVNLGMSEIYGASFVRGGSESAYEIEQPLSADKTHLRQSLTQGMKEALLENSKYFAEVRLFELGNVFDRKLGERTMLALSVKGKGEEAFLELKGTVEGLLTGLGFTDFNLYPERNSLEVEVNGEKLGEIKHYQKDSALAELDALRLMQMEEGEFEYQPLSKYPSVMRDLSIALRERVSVGDILSAIEEVGVEHARDVDLIDYYDPQHLTFRIVFQSDDRTLKDAEVSKEFEKIVKYLKRKFPLEIR